jgi:hypothetical protein
VVCLVGHFEKASRVHFMFIKYCFVYNQVKKEGKKEEKGKPEANTEKMSAGSVTWKTYWEYFQSGGSSLYFAFVVFNFASSQLCFTAADYWLSLWYECCKLLQSRLVRIRL